MTNEQIQFLLTMRQNASTLFDFKDEWWMNFNHRGTDFGHDAVVASYEWVKQDIIGAKTLSNFVQAVLNKLQDYENSESGNPTTSRLHRSPVALDADGAPICHCEQGHYGMHNDSCGYMIWKRTK